MTEVTEATGNLKNIHLCAVGTNIKKLLLHTS